MTKAGGGTAYQKLQTPEDGIGQALQFWGAQEAKRVGEEKLAEERAGIRKDAAVKEWESIYNLKADDFRNKYTGFKSYDDMATDFSIDTTNQYVELQRKAKDSMLRGDSRGKADAEMEMVKMKNTFGEAAKVQPMLSKLFQDYQTAASEGKVSGASKDFEDAMQAGFKDYNVAMRYRNGNLVFTGLSEDGKVFNIPKQDILDGSFNWIEKQQVDGKGGLVDGILNNLGTVTTETQSGYNKITKQVWDEKLHGKAAKTSIEALTGNDSIMADLLYQFSLGKTSKRVGFDKKDYDLVQGKLEELVKGGYSTKYASEFNASKYNTDVDARLARERMAIEKRPKGKTKEETEYGARRFNIGEVTKGDTSFFNSGDFKWGGQDYVSKGAKLIGDNIVIQTEDGVIKVPKNNETAINNLLNAFEKKTTTFDKVMSVDAYPWRESRVTTESDITSLLSGQYSNDGKFIGDENDFVSAISKIYPEAKVRKVGVFSGGLGSDLVEINGEEIDLGSLTKAQVEEKLRSAVGEKPSSSSPSAMDLINKYKTK